MYNGSQLRGMRSDQMETEGLSVCPTAGEVRYWHSAVKHWRGASACPLVHRNGTPGGVPARTKNERTWGIVGKGIAHTPRLTLATPEAGLGLWTGGPRRLGLKPCGCVGIQGVCERAWMAA